MAEALRGLVLFVDDDADTCEFVEALLMSHGLRCRTVRSAAGALAAAAVVRFDVVVVDLGLRDEVDGAELARRLRQAPDPPPVIIQTGQPQDAIPADLRDAGYIQKPYDPDALLNAIADAIDESRQ